MLITEWNGYAKITPTSVEQFVDFSNKVNYISNHMEELTSRFGDITASNLLIEEFKIRCPEGMKASVTKCNSELGILRKKIEEAFANYD